MRTALACMSLAVLAVLIWLLLPGTEAPLLPSQPAAAGSTSATVDARATAAGRDAPSAAPAPAPSPAPAAERELAPLPAGTPANVRVVMFGTDDGVAGITVRFVRPDIDWEKMSAAEREEYGRLFSDEEALHRRYGQECLTDSTGACYVSPGKYGTQVRARGGDLYAEGLVRADQKEPVVLRLRPDRTLRVLVVDAAGRPTPGMRVRCRRVPGAGPVDPMQGEWDLATTDDAGHAEQRHWQNMAGDEKSRLVELKAVAPGGEGPGVVVETTAPPDEVVLHLPAAGAVVVHVRDAKGRPLDVDYLEHPTVNLTALDKPPGSRERKGVRNAAGAKLDANADARFPCVMFDRWLMVEMGDSARAECAGPTLEHPAIEVTVQESTDDVIVAGLLLQSDGAPFASRQLMVKCRFERGFLQRDLRTDTRGRFRCNLGTAMKDRQCAVGFTTDTQLPDALAVELPQRTLRAGINDLGEVQLAPLKILVAGRLRCDEGVTATQVWMEFERKQGTGWMQEDNLRPQWQPDGSFTVRSGIAAGEPLRISVREGPYLPVEPIECKTGDTAVEIHLSAAGSATATFLCEDGAPVGLLAVRLERTEPPEKPDPRKEMLRGFDRFGMQVKDGRCAKNWTGLVPGTYRLTVECQGSGEPFLTIDAIPIRGQCTDPRLSDIDLRGRLRSLEIRATGKDGADIADRDAFVLVQSKGKDWRGYNLQRGVACVVTTATVDLLVIARGYQMARAESVAASCSIALQPATTAKLAIALPSALPDGVHLQLLLQPQLGFRRDASVTLDTGRGMGLASFFSEEVAVEAAGAGDAAIDAPVRWPGEYAIEGRLSRSDAGGYALRGFEPRKVTLPGTGVTTVRVGAKALDDVLQRLKK